MADVSVDKYAYLISFSKIIKVVAVNQELNLYIIKKNASQMYVALLGEGCGGVSVVYLCSAG